METDEDGLTGLDDVISLPNWLLSDSDFYGYYSSFVFADNKLYIYGRKDILCIDLSNGTRTKMFQDVELNGTTITDEGVYYKDDDDMLYLNSEDTRICDFPIGAYGVGDGAVAVVNKEDTSEQKSVSVYSPPSTSYQPPSIAAKKSSCSPPRPRPKKER